MASITDFVSGAGFPNPLDGADFDDNMEDLRQIAQDHTHPAARARSQADNVDGHRPSSYQIGSEGPELMSLRCQADGCSFSTIKSQDPTDLQHLVKLLDIHTRTVHDVATTDKEDSEERDPSRAAKKSRELKAALASRKVTKTLDDANLNLCEARFYTFPMNLKVLGQNMPVTATPINTVVDLSHLGVDVTNSEVLRKIHSRGETSMELNHFSDTNMRASNSSSDELVAIQAKFDKNQLKLGRHLKEIANVKEALKAFSNYMAIARHFHPLDTSQMALQRVALEKFFIASPTVADYSRFFKKFVHESSVRAHMKAVPLSYKEILDIWNTYIQPPSITQINIEKMVDEKIKKMAGGKGRQGKSVDNRAKKPKHQWCPSWNVTPTPPFCTNQQIDGGCIDGSGSQYVHSCSFRLARGGTCGSNKHNKHTH